MPSRDSSVVRLEPGKGTAVVTSGSIEWREDIIFWNETEKERICRKLAAELLKDGKLGMGNEPVDVVVFPSRG